MGIKVISVISDILRSSLHDEEASGASVTSLSSRTALLPTREEMVVNTVQPKPHPEMKQGSK